MRQNTANAEIRQAAQKAGVYLWKVADELGITDKTLTLWMRHELPEDKKLQILNIIGELAAER